jgi:hypothetical protein
LTPPDEGWLAPAGFPRREDELPEDDPGRGFPLALPALRARITPGAAMTPPAGTPPHKYLHLQANGAAA